MPHSKLSLLIPNKEKEASSENICFPLLDSSGKRIGYIDSISTANNLLSVDGWAFSTLVGLTNDHHKVESKPSLVRHDVLSHTSNKQFSTPGFTLAIPLTDHYTIFWAESEGIRYVYPLPKYTPE